ncbi:hypothetical protein [Hyalangium versicolor]|uniref:hypothetical protein n=1 Tax=Hyalangium versicolor TaxID=2861190 RepID=UPI001CCF9571|nr:hypothetical protein [Hyalangium versicolor]
MRRTVLTLCLLLPLMSMAESQEARGDMPPPPHPPPFAMKSWVEVLLEHRQDLALTDAQVAGMERIQQALDEKNAPLKQTLEQLRPPPPPQDVTGQGGQRGFGMRGGNRPDPSTMDAEHRARFEQARGTMDQLRANDDAAYSEAEALLSASQRQAAQAIVTAEKEARESRRQEMHQRMRERMGARGGDL